jgi:hypothetical protein
VPTGIVGSALLLKEIVPDDDNDTSAPWAKGARRTRIAKRRKAWAQHSFMTRERRTWHLPNT